jgi:hypothetical protein
MLPQSHEVVKTNRIEGYLQSRGGALNSIEKQFDGEWARLKWEWFQLSTFISGFAGQARGNGNSTRQIPRMRFFPPLHSTFYG